MVSSHESPTKLKIAQSWHKLGSTEDLMRIPYLWVYNRADSGP